MEKAAETHIERKALYAGSFDPPTNGHLWVIEQGAELFDTLHVAVTVNPSKTGTFTDAERVEMLEEISSPYPNVQVTSFKKRYTVHVARDLGCRYLLRGIRNAQDHDAEQTLNHVNRGIAPEINTILLPGPEELLKVSSSGVKGMIGPEGWEEAVTSYVPEFVLKALVRKQQEREARERQEADQASRQ